MNSATKKESPNGQLLSSSNGTTRIPISAANSANHQFNYNHRSSIRSNSFSPHQPQSFETIGSHSVSFNSEENCDNINSIDENSSAADQFSYKIDQLQRQIEALTESQVTQVERHKRSCHENDVLQNRINLLEDQLRDIEFNAEVRAKEDEKRFKETMARQMKIHTQECEQHLNTNFQIQQELFQLKNDLLKSEALIKTLRTERDSLESELAEKNSELCSLDEELHKLKLVIRSLKDEECVKDNLISILNEQLEDSQNGSQQISHDDLTASSRVSSSNSPKSKSAPYQHSRRSSITSGLGDDICLSNGQLVHNVSLKDFDGLEMSLSKVKEENESLREQNEELQAQLLNLQLEEGRSLVRDGNKSFSLADEIEGKDIDVQELKRALIEQKDDNARYRKYMEEILLKVVEKHPEMLDKTSPNQKARDQASLSLKQSGP